MPACCKDRGQAREDGHRNEPQQAFAAARYSGSLLWLSLETRVVDLSSSSVYQNVTSNNYVSLNSQWTYSHCESGACWYYNVPGDYVSVGIDGSKLGKAHAATYVSVQGHDFLTDALGYVGDLINSWQNGSLVAMNALATDSAVSFLRGGRMILQVGDDGIQRFIGGRGAALAGARRRCGRPL